MIDFSVVSFNYIMGTEAYSPREQTFLYFHFRRVLGRFVKTASYMCIDNRREVTCVESKSARRKLQPNLGLSSAERII